MAHRIIPDPAAKLPITVGEAKSELRIVGSRDDAGLELKIRAAVARLETECGCVFAPRTIEFWGNPAFMGLPVRLPLSYGGATFVSATADGVALAPLTFYDDCDGYSCLDLPAEAWLSARRLSVTYTVEGSMPDEVRSAALLLVGHLNENREATFQGAINELPLGVDYLVAHHRRNLGV